MSKSGFFAFLLFALCLAGAPAGVSAGDGVSAAATAAEAYRRGHEHQIIDEFMTLLAIPNHGLDRVNIAANATHIAGMLRARGIDTRILELAGSPPAVLGRMDTPGADKTVVFYIHYDGQPVNPADWASPPYAPLLRAGRLDRGAKVIDRAGVRGAFDPEWRIYARSASDDKAPVIGLLAAIDALREAGIALSVNVKIFLEGEEELGSPHLGRMIETYRAALAADLWVFLDGPVHPSGQNQIAFGVRGATGFDLTVYGPARPLHSGHYGNYAPNPIMLLAHLLTSMRDDDSHILIDGYYDDVVAPTATEQAWIKAAPGGNEEMRTDLGIGRSESAGLRVEEAILWPAINIRGLRAGEVGEQASNIIVTEATASVGLRLVPDQTPASVRPLIEKHIAGQGYHILDRAPTAAERLKYPRIARIDWEGGYPGVRTPLDRPASKALIEILSTVTGGKAVVVPGMGGSLPIWYIKDILGAPIVMLPIVNHDNNQHAENENLRLGNLWTGIDIYAAVLANIGAMMTAAGGAP